MTANPYWPAPQPDSLGMMAGADDVRDALKATIDTWSAYYVTILSQRLAEAGLIGGRDQPPNPLQGFETFTNQPGYRNIGTGQPAVYLVTVAGTVGTPAMRGTGAIEAVYRANVEVHTFGTDWQEAADLTSWYEKAVRWSILQHRSLGGVANTTSWLGTSYSKGDAGGHSSKRTEGIAQMGFNVKMPDVIDVFRGPSTVPVGGGSGGPPPDDPTVDDVIFDLTKVPVTEDL